ncbi:MAG TPA: transcription antitermination factor NusB [Ignavibacteria bacterium]|jgi:N utilization substance protein B
MAASKRRDMRIKVVQILYAHELSKDPIEKVKKDQLTEIEDEELYHFACELIRQVLDNSKKIDKLIEGSIDNWELERIALLDKLVLRMGVAELMAFPDIPTKVTINEAIDISKLFGTNNSGKFVNGVLDAIHNRLIKEGKIEKSGRGLLDTKKKPDEK